MKKSTKGSPTKTHTKKRAILSTSAVVQVRQIKPMTQLLLCVRAGGRCEFDGCNKYLFKHHLTHTPGNFAQMAHIVAFKEDGPRGSATPRPSDINDIKNLMLLCPECHHLIDTHATDYPREVLEKYKENHEERIYKLTGTNADYKTTVVQLKTLIGGQPVAIPVADVHRAIAPRYAEDPRGYIIDLTNIHGDDQVYYQTAMRTIRQEVERLYAPGMDVEKTRHISLFGLAPIPLLIYLGNQLSNKVPVDLFQRHRDTEDWVWKKSGKPVGYKFRQLRSGTIKSKVALVLSLSGKIHLGDLPPEIDKRFYVYEITLARGIPKTTYLRMKKDLTAFREVYHSALSEIRANHGQLKGLHLFPAVPAPIAVLCGREVLTKITPALLVYDNDQKNGGFKFILGVNYHD
jgi:SMODS-associated and fused to various effectors sensor domain/HNH endonuclease